MDGRRATPPFYTYEGGSQVTSATRARRAVGLCAITVGLMALSVSIAHAEAGAKWLILNAAETTKTELLATIGFKEFLGGSGTFKTRIAGAEVKFRATGAELIGLGLEPEGKLTVGGKIKFTGVQTFLNGALSAVCLPNEPLGAPDIVVTEKLKGELVLHTGGVGVVKIEPEVGNVLARIHFGEECPLPELVPIIGKAFLKDPLGISNLLVEHEAVELSALTALWAISETVEHRGILEGGAVIRLTGAHFGLKWSGIPG
jgi:hypothetical protein